MRANGMLLMITVCWLLIGALKAYGQQSPNYLRASIKDSVTKSGIGTATATIYVGKDSTVLKYAFTNNFGGVRFEDLPLDTPLIIKITHLGYRTFEHKFRLKKSSPSLDLGDVLLSARANNLQEVSIVGQRPPLQMHGDTLEINAEAFKTKENAVVEDLLRKVPGIVVWADGKISVNGKNVSRLFVEGKPFFGNDPVVAMRNLPKEAIDKVKVYDDKSSSDPFNVTPQAIMDVTLKKGMKSGFFGKAGAGFGTDKREEGNVAINYFSPKDQISALVVKNNTNKEVFDVQSMLRQTVYKPGGNDNTSYQSNFSMPGLNNFKAVGLNFSRDLSKTENTKVEYFNNAMQNATVRDIDDLTSLTNGLLKEHSYSDETSDRENHRIKGHFQNRTEKHELTLDPIFDVQNANIRNEGNTLATNENAQNLSGSVTSYNISRKDNRLNLGMEYLAKNPDMLNEKYQIRYRLLSNEYSVQEQLKNTFDVYTTSVMTRSVIARKREESRNALSQNLYGQLNVSEILGYQGPFKMSLSNSLKKEEENRTQIVHQLDSLTNLYSIANPYLTNSAAYTLLEETPGLGVDYSKQVTGVRNVKNFSFGIRSDVQMINQHNNSQKQFQRFSRNYTSPIHSFYLRFNHSKEGLFNKLYSVRYTEAITIPTVDQLTPLVDSVNRYNLYFGNANLKKQQNREIAFSYQNYLANNGGIFKLDIAAGLTKNKFTDSSTYDASGQRKSYTVNESGYKYITASFSYERSGKFFGNPFGIKAFPRFSIYQSPFYVNNQQHLSKNMNGSLLWIVNYVQGDLLLYDVLGTVNFSRSSFGGASGTNSFQSLSTSSGADIQLSWPKHTTIVNAVTYDVNSNSYDKTIRNFIWNASIYYRLFKKEQLELKLTAADILRQRSNLLRTVNSNTLRIGTINNLQQFFMVSIAYYPRQFGSAKK